MRLSREVEPCTQLDSNSPSLSNLAFVVLKTCTEQLFHSDPESQEDSLGSLDPPRLSKIDFYLLEPPYTA